MAVLEDDGEEENEEKSDVEESDAIADHDSDKDTSEEDSDSDQSETLKRAHEDSSDSDAKPAITKKKSVSARNLKRQKIVPNKSSGFFDDLSRVSEQTEVLREIGNQDMAGDVGTKTQKHENHETQNAAYHQKDERRLHERQIYMNMPERHPHV